MSEYRTPEWYDAGKLRKVVYGEFEGGTKELGWIVDLGDGTCRIANDPMTINAAWGDRFRLLDERTIDPEGLIEKYDPEVDRVTR